MSTDTTDGRPFGACKAENCPCRGTMDLTTSGRSYCQWHAWALPNDWPRITQELEEHRWLIDFITEVEICSTRGRRGDWQAKARDFFRTDPHCQPSKVEIDRYNFYGWRLREELAWRIGVRKDRPSPRLPGIPTPTPKQQELAA